jgi:hypothetical protein
VYQPFHVASIVWCAVAHLIEEHIAVLDAARRMQIHLADGYFACKVPSRDPLSVESFLSNMPAGRLVAMNALFESQDLKRGFELFWSTGGTISVKS